MAEFASKWPDVRLWAIGRVNAALGSVASAERHEDRARQVVVSVVPAQMETAASRYYMVTVEAWDSTSKSAALKLAGDAAYEIESAPRDGNPLIKAELNAGPNENRDDSGEYFYDVTVLATIHRSK